MTFKEQKPANHFMILLFNKKYIIITIINMRKQINKKTKNKNE